MVEKIPLLPGIFTSPKKKDGHRGAEEEEKKKKLTAPEKGPEKSD